MPIAENAALESTKTSGADPLSFTLDLMRTHRLFHGFGGLLPLCHLLGPRCPLCTLIEVPFGPALQLHGRILCTVHLLLE